MPDRFYRHPSRIIQCANCVSKHRIAPSLRYNVAHLAGNTVLMNHFKFPAYALALALGAACAGAQADDLPAVGNVHAPLTVTMPDIPEGGWFTSAELGAITTSGNTTG